MRVVDCPDFLNVDQNAIQKSAEPIAEGETLGEAINHVMQKIDGEEIPMTGYYYYTNDSSAFCVYGPYHLETDKHVLQQ